MKKIHALFENLESKNKGKKSDNEFQEFLYAEYSHIAEAHFNTIETISEFFKSYLTIITIPLTLIAIAANTDFVKNKLSYLTKEGATSLAGRGLSMLIIVIGLIGFCVFWYMLNLRWDALLYARTINGIRKFFYNHNIEMDLLEKERIRVLPQSPQLPSYIEIYYFGPVLIAFILLNCSYVAAGIFGFIYFAGNKKPLNEPITWIIPICFALLHLILYFLLAYRREYGRQRFHILGVDIDGVLNKHREQFSEILKQQVGKIIDPDKIVKIPVHDCIDLNVTDDDEKIVFNTSDYWTTMPENNGAKEVIKKIRNSYNIRIHIFTSRNWPVFKDDTDVYTRRDTLERWAGATSRYLDEVYGTDRLKNFYKRLLRNIKSVYPYRFRSIKKMLTRKKSIELITEAWLDQKEFIYDKLVVEFGSEDVSDPNSHIYNRFHAARIMPIKYFVEDDPKKAKKLSYICDFVFLINHPYNNDINLPPNVIRVNNWNQILEMLRAIV